MSCISCKWHEKSEVEIEIAVCMKMLYISNALQSGYDPIKMQHCLFTVIFLKIFFSLVIFLDSGEISSVPLNSTRGSPTINFIIALLLCNKWLAWFKNARFTHHFFDGKFCTVDISPFFPVFFAESCLSEPDVPFESFWLHTYLYNRAPLGVVCSFVLNFFFFWNN